MPVMDTVTTAQDKVVEYVKMAQEPVVESVRTAAEFADSRLPELPELPFADQLPSLAEVVDNSFGFARQLLDIQHDFAKAILEAASPLLPETAKPKATVKKASNSAAA